LIFEVDDCKVISGGVIAEDLMKFTMHGNERVLGRTKMLTEDVLSLICADAVVALGSLSGCEYLLFYSPPDRCAKIAVVSPGRELLISVWERNFTLPPGIVRVTKMLETKAYCAARAFLLQRILARQPKKPARQCPMKIDVIERGKVAYVDDAGTISSDDIYSRETVLALTATRLKLIFRIVEENKVLDGWRVRYSVRILDPDTLKSCREYRFGRNTLTKLT
jgi:hypothetical protein